MDLELGHNSMVSWIHLNGIFNFKRSAIIPDVYVQPQVFRLHHIVQNCIWCLSSELNPVWKNKLFCQTTAKTKCTTCSYTCHWASTNNSLPLGFNEQFTATGLQ